MFPHHSDQMSQRSQVSLVALWGSSLNVFVIVFVIVIVFVFVIVFLLVRLRLLITLIKCLKGHKSLGLLFYVKIKRCVTDSVTRPPIELWTAKKVFDIQTVDQKEKNRKKNGGKTSTRSFFPDPPTSWLNFTSLEPAQISTGRSCGSANVYRKGCKNFLILLVKKSTDAPSPTTRIPWVFL